ncbi:MAG: DinB family protein [Acidimicrobiales bacterium]
MEVAEVLLDAFGRVAQSVHGVLDEASEDQLFARVDEDANSICWLVWHLTRVEDDHVAHVAGKAQVWISGGWQERFALPFDPRDTGYGHRPADVAAVKAEGGLLAGYFDAVDDSVAAYVSTLSSKDLDRVVDQRWDPPVTLGVRLVSVIGDAIAHAAQAEFVLGVLRRRAGA